ncbi:MAG: family 16 glycosylhydrolase [Clostridia bacterium]|nr:family 16 glycosylhydrolase [Clostridia bacterium]
MIKKTLFLILIIITSLAAVCYAAPPDADYQLVLSDEFEGSVLNTDMWTYRTGNPYGGKNLKENVRVEDGKLCLDYKKINETYTGGGIITPFTLPYGYYEVKAKVFSGVNGLHTSFWTSGATDSFEVLPENTPFNNHLLEIDAFEINSREDEEVPNVDHGINNWCGGHTVPFSANYYETDTTKDWFVMGMEWLPDSVKYYINGNLINSFEGLNIFGPSYLWLTAVASPEKYNNGDGTYNIDDSKMDENGYFGSSLFEYFRYYQKPLKGVNLMGNPNFEYNRATDSVYPSAFVLKGDKNASYIQKTPLAYDGLYYHTHQSLTPYFLSTGQEFAALCPGKYTFSGQFKATDGFTTARIVVYDKEGNVLSEKPIPKATEWTEVSITDIQIESYAYAAVESASDGGTMLSVDALKFYIQDGEAYEHTNTPYYEHIEDTDPLASYTYGLNDAKSVTGEWLESGSDKGTYWLTGDLRDVEVVWEISVENSDTYRLDVKNLIHANNTESQDYYITLPDGTEEKITLDTKNGVTRWDTLGKYNIKEDETLKVAMKSSSKSGNVRITKLRFISESDISAYESTTIRLSEPVFCHFGNPCIFDKTNTNLTPYEQDGIYYIPYKALKDTTGYTADINESSAYVTTKQLKDSGVGVTLYEDYILLHDANTVHTQNSIIKATRYLAKFSEPRLQQNAVFIANTDEPCQITQTADNALLVGLSWKSSNNILKHKYSNRKNASATWTFDISKDGTYTVDIFSPGLANSTTNAEITVYSRGENNTLNLNQTGAVGWYRLKTLNAKAGDKIIIYMEQKAKGYMRAANVRIVPLSLTPEITTDGENVFIQLGDNYGIAKAIILAEYIDGVPNYTLKLPTGTSLYFTLNNKENPYKLFFWKSLESGIPLCAPIKNN